MTAAEKQKILDDYEIFANLDHDDDEKIDVRTIPDLLLAVMYDDLAANVQDNSDGDPSETNALIKYRTEIKRRHVLDDTVITRIFDEYNSDPDAHIRVLQMRMDLGK